MENINIGGMHFYNMVINASNRLEEKKEYVNSLNVFPVPDGDTGTNMSLTFKAAVNDILSKKDEPIGEVSKTLSRGALMGARGNSGVILSQIFRGIAKGLEGKTEVTAKEFATALKEGANFAYKAVMRPTEGTILTVIREAGEFAEKCNEEDVTSLMEKVCAYAEKVLNKTPEMLPALKEAKVVDAGGMGLLILLKGMTEVLKNNLQAELADNIVSQSVEVNIGNVEAEIENGYCTEFLISSDKVNEDKFKEELSQMGDSIVVVILDDIVKVHIHTEDPGAVLSKAVKFGELSKIKIENMREQHRSTLGIDNNLEIIEEKNEIVEEKEFGFVAVASGAGLKNIFEDLGVDTVIEGGQTMNPSTQDIVESISKVNARIVFVLPNNKNIIMAAEQSIELCDKEVIVLQTKTIPQGISALSVFNSFGDKDSNLQNMKDAISGVATGSVTYAVKDTESDGREIKENDILGLMENKISEIGKEKFEVLEQLLENMIDEDSELVTIYYGEDCTEEDVEEFIEKMEEKYEDVDIECYNGSQPVYYFIVSVE